MKKQFISILEVVTLLALLFAPLSLLYVDSTLLFPYITSKNFAWRFAIDFALVGWACLAILDARYRINLRNPIFLSFTFFILVMGIANLTGFDPFRSFWSNAERMDGYVGLLHMFGFFLALLGFVRAQKESTQLYNYLQVGLFTVIIGSIYSSVIARTMSTTGTAEASSFLWFLLSIILMAVTSIGAWDKPNFMKSFFHGLLSLGVLFGMMALLEESSRADAVLGNPIYLASYASFAVFMSGYYLVSQERIFGKKYLKEIIYGLLMLFFIVVIFETATRGAILGLLFGGLTTSTLLAFFAKKDEEKIWRKIGIGIALFIVISIGGFFGLKNQIAQSDFFADGSLIARAANFNLEDTTTKHRISNWGMAIEGFKDRPLLGWGQENYIHVFSQKYRANELYDAEQWFDRTHNMFLDWLVFGGILGLLSFLTLLASGIYCVWRLCGHAFTTPEKSILTGTVVAYMAQNFVAFDSLATGMWITLIFGFIALRCVFRNSGSPLVIKPFIEFISIGTLIVSLSVWLSVSYYQPRASMRDFMALLQAVPQGVELNDVMAARYIDLEQGMELGTFLNQEYIEQLLSRVNLYNREGISEEVRAQYVSLVYNYASTHADEHPEHTRANFFFGVYLHNAQAYEAAEVYLERALVSSPEKIQILWYLGRNALALADNESASEYFRQAALYAPDFGQAQDAYAEFKDL